MKKSESLDELLEKRNIALRNLDIAYVTAMGCAPEFALNALHKARFECTAIEPNLRHASRAWLEANGLGRYMGREWPPKGELPA